MTADGLRTDAVLRVRDLRVAYAGNQAVAVDALDVAPGEIVGVIGANGWRAGRAARRAWPATSRSTAGASTTGRRTSACAPDCCWCPRAGWCSRA
jgi:ABC-type phosphonate transport system ATPase subunit